MPRPRRPRLVVLAIVAVVVGILAPGGHASAHNSLLSSDPADGAVLTEPPAQITWLFDNAVPLETMTVLLIDASGVRTELAGSMHGANESEVLTPLPALQPGAVSLRWRLVGPDGHPITGRVDFTIAAGPATTGERGQAPTTSTPPTIEESSSDDLGFYDTPSAARWVLRYSAYLSIMAAVGILLITAFVWPDAGAHTGLRRLLSGSLVATAVLGLLQLLVVASDVSGDPPWQSFGAIDAATTTHAGMALALRVAIALAMWLVVFRAEVVHRDVYWAAVAIPGIALLATWAFAGHSRSVRWPALGVPADVAHHAAAAAWIAGLGIVGWLVIPRQSSAVLAPIVRRFSRLAAVSVTVLVATGLVQSARLVGNPTNLRHGGHGKALALKLVLVVVMLALAAANRRRLTARLADHGTASGLQRAIVAEFAIGLAIVGITAAMVVAPPATALGAVYYAM